MTMPEAHAPRRVRSPHPVLLASALGLLAVLVFLPALDCGFVAYDDPRTSPEYSQLVRGASSETLAWAFGEADFYGNWLPVTLLTHLLDWELFGENPRGHHLTSLLLHAASVALLFWLWFRATGAVWRPAAVAALWAVHPLRVEPVVWLAARQHVLSALLALAALLLYVRWVRRRSALRYLAVVAAFTLALLAKSIAMTLPLVMLLLDVWPLARWSLPARGTARERAAALVREGWPLVREKLPLLLVAAAVAAMAVVTQLRGGALADLGSRPLGARLEVAALAVPRYLAALVWPSSLAPFYPLSVGPPRAGLAALAGAAVVGVTVLVLASARRWPWLSSGWLWFLVVLLPVSGLAQVGDHSHADRYTYLASVGLLVAAAWSAGEALRRRPAWRPAAVAAAIALVAAWIVATRTQIGHWRSSETLFTHTLAVDSDNPMAHLNLGVLRATEGRLDDAIAHARRAAELRPGLAGAHNNLGTALLAQGDRAGARAAFEEAIRRDPELASAHFNLAVLLADAGERGRAVGHLARVVSVQPDYGPAWRGLAELLTLPGVAAEAAPFVAALRRAHPGSAELGRVEAMVRAASGVRARPGGVE